MNVTSMPRADKTHTLAKHGVIYTVSLARDILRRYKSGVKSSVDYLLMYCTKQIHILSKATNTTLILLHM
jgi:hypothetical protein